MTENLQRHRPVHRAGVDIDKAKPFGERRCHGALPDSHRAVDSYYRFGSCHDTG